MCSAMFRLSFSHFITLSLELSLLSLTPNRCIDPCPKQNTLFSLLNTIARKGHHGRGRQHYRRPYLVGI
uniref:Putative secreted protein n=1 Tax=Anopheles darlingi TaxID=43151 RepID=A0A2M4DSH5_ANODA